MRGQGGQVVNNPPWGMKVRIRQKEGLRITIGLTWPWRGAAIVLYTLISITIACGMTGRSLLPIDIDWGAQIIGPVWICLTAVCITAVFSGRTRISLSPAKFVVRYPLLSFKRRVEIDTERLVGVENERHEKLVSNGETHHIRVDMDLVVVQNGAPRELCLLSTRRWKVAAYARDTLQRYLKILQNGI